MEPLPDSLHRSSPSDVVGASPPRDARPVSLAVRDYLRRHFGVHNRSSDGSGIVFAVSGGADSLSLAVAGADQAQRMGIPYSAAIVNHGLREESEVEALEVAARLRSLGLTEVEVLDASTAEVDLEHPLEGWAREIRHKLLSEYAQNWAQSRGKGRTLDSVDILYGHTQDDQAETVLMRLGRGSSPRSLSAMRERVLAESTDARGSSCGSGVPVYRGRPLLGVRRSDTVAFCRALGLTWVDDPSNSAEGTWTNASGSALPRTALRHRVIPILGDALGQDPIPALARVAQLLAEDEEALNALAVEALAEVWRGGQEDRSLDVQTVKELPAALRKRVYLLAWNRLTSPQEEALLSVQLGSIDQLVMNSPSGPYSPIGKKASLPGGWIVQRSRECLTFRRLHPGG